MHIWRLERACMCPAEKAMVPHSRTLAWKIPWMEEPGRLQSMGPLRVGTSEQLHFHFSLSCTGEGNGNPLQCSCLENPRDGEAWRAAIYGVAQSWTRLKRLSSSSTSSMCPVGIARREWSKMSHDGSTESLLLLEKVPINHSRGKRV